MTDRDRRGFTISRHDLSEACKNRFAALKSEGAGNAGCALHRRSRVQNCKKKRTRAYRFSGGNPTFPAQWFYGLLRALPGDQACLTPSPALLIADLTPASGRRNHTTSPYANSAIVKGTAASTASRPASMTLANAPLKGRDRANQ